MHLKTDIERILKEKNMSKTEFAEKMGIIPQSVTKLLAGNPTLETLRKMATALEVSVCEILGETPRLQRKPGYVYIPILDLTASAGHGIAHQPAQIEDYIVMKELDFRIDFAHVDPSKATIITIRGDSMSTTFLDGDRVIVNTADTEPCDGIFSLFIDDHQYVKRLQRQPGGAWIASSDNRNYAPITITESTPFKIQGRIIGAIMVRRV